MTSAGEPCFLVEYLKLDRYLGKFNVGILPSYIRFVAFNSGLNTFS